MTKHQKGSWWLVRCGGKGGKVIRVALDKMTTEISGTFCLEAVFNFSRTLQVFKYGASSSGLFGPCPPLLLSPPSQYSFFFLTSFLTLSSSLSLCSFIYFIAFFTFTFPIINQFRTEITLFHASIQQFKNTELTVRYYIPMS